MKQAVLLASHGTVDDLDDLPAFLQNVRRGRAAPPELLAEVRRRYQTVGGSPLNRINAEVARKLGVRMRLPVQWANRLWRPTVRDAMNELARAGVERVGLVPLAQHSAEVYGADARGAALDAGVKIACAPNWGQSAALTQAFAARVIGALGPDDGVPTSLVLTAHSLPQSVVDAGDPYEREVRDSARAVWAAVKPSVGPSVRLEVAFQSQGLAGPGGAPLQWLGPDLPTVLGTIAARGDKRVVFAPIGFLADHIEILYDLDVEARALAAERGLAYARAQSLNADEDLIEVLAQVARPLLDHE